MAPAVFETGHYEYVQEHLRILSAFYGVLKPMDGVTPYRLEMQARASIGEARDLGRYNFQKFLKLAVIYSQSVRIKDKENDAADELQR